MFCPLLSKLPAVGSVRGYPVELRHVYGMVSFQRMLLTACHLSRNGYRIAGGGDGGGGGALDRDDDAPTQNSCPRDPEYLTSQLFRETKNVMRQSNF